MYKIDSKMGMFLDRHYVCRSHDLTLGISPTFVKKEKSSSLFFFLSFFLLRLFFASFFLLRLFLHLFFRLFIDLPLSKLAPAHVSSLLNLVLPLLTIFRQIFCSTGRLVEQMIWAIFSIDFGLAAS